MHKCVLLSDAQGFAGFQQFCNVYHRACDAFWFVLLAHRVWSYDESHQLLIGSFLSCFLLCEANHDFLYPCIPISNRLYRWVLHTECKCFLRRFVLVVATSSPRHHVVFLFDTQFHNRIQPVQAPISRLWFESFESFVDVAFMAQQYRTIFDLQLKANKALVVQPLDPELVFETVYDCVTLMSFFPDDETVINHTIKDKSINHPYYKCSELRGHWFAL